MIRRFLTALRYRVRRSRAEPQQKEHLPKSYSEYLDYKKTYGVAPGDGVHMSGNVGVVVDIEGPPTIDAQVTYIDLEEDIEYTTGLVNVIRQQ